MISVILLKPERSPASEMHFSFYFRHSITYGKCAYQYPPLSGRACAYKLAAVVVTLKQEGAVKAERLLVKRYHKIKHVNREAFKRRDTLESECRRRLWYYEIIQQSLEDIAQNQE